MTAGEWLKKMLNAETPEEEAEAKRELAQATQKQLGGYVSELRIGGEDMLRKAD